MPTPSDPTWASSPWLFRPRPRDAARARLVCFAHAGGSAGVFRGWPAGMPDDVDIVSLQLPGRVERYREPLLTSVAAMVEGITRAVTPFLSGAPTYFFGHSLGAVLAFETARSLRRSAHPLPRALLLSSALPPSSSHRSRGLARLPDATFIAVLKRMGALPEMVWRDAELLQLFLPVVRADLRAFEDWAPGDEAALDVPIAAFGGVDDDHPPAVRLEEWRRETSAALSVQTFPGGHFYWTHAPESLWAAIRDHLHGRQP